MQARALCVVCNAVVNYVLAVRIIMGMAVRSDDSKYTLPWTPAQNVGGRQCHLRTIVRFLGSNLTAAR